VRRTALLNGGGAIEASLMMLNGSAKDHDFRVPPTNLHWAMALDSSEPSRTLGSLESDTVKVPAHAVVLLMGQQNGQ
jgi:hypothetical protein